MKSYIFFKIKKVFLSRTESADPDPEPVKKGPDPQYCLVLVIYVPCETFYDSTESIGNYSAEEKLFSTLPPPFQNGHVSLTNLDLCFFLHCTTPLKLLDPPLCTVYCEIQCTWVVIKTF